MKTVYVGIDLGSKFCVGTAPDSKGNILNSRSFGTSEKNLIDYVAGQKGKTRVLMEECELAGWVYRTLLPNAFISSDLELSGMLAPLSRNPALAGIRFSGWSFWIKSPAGPVGSNAGH